MLETQNQVDSDIGLWGESVLSTIIMVVWSCVLTSQEAEMIMGKIVCEGIMSYILEASLYIWK